MKIYLLGFFISFGLFACLFFNFPEKPKVFKSLPFENLKEFKLDQSERNKQPDSPLKPALSFPEYHPSQEVEKITPTLSGKPLFYLIIDDVGSDRSFLDSFLELNFFITFAIMPRTSISLGEYEKILKKGQESILHIPMEPINGSIAGREQINLGDSPDVIEKKLREAFASFPEIKGFNNHMGSAVTSSRNEISAILDYAKKNGIFFVDSFTVASSLGVSIGKEKGMQVARRDIFLDNISEEEAINKMLNKALAQAEKQKRVVAIGHIWSQELASVLKKRESDLIKKVEFRPISMYFKDIL